MLWKEEEALRGVGGVELEVVVGEAPDANAQYEAVLCLSASFLTRYLIHIQRDEAQ